MSLDLQLQPATFIGIDPGLSGAVVALNSEGKVIRSTKAPVYKTARQGTRYNLKEMLHLLKGLQKISPLTFCCIEKSQSRPTDSRPAAWTTGCGFGYWQMALVSLDIPYEIVRPKQWQKLLFVPGKAPPKELSIRTAKQLIPDLNLLPTPRCRKEDHNLSDAGLIALYCTKTYRR